MNKSENVTIDPGGKSGEHRVIGAKEGEYCKEERFAVTKAACCISRNPNRGSVIT